MARGTSDRIAIIGAGHMGTALAEGFARAGIPRSRVILSDGSATNARAAEKADWIFIAVRPGVVPRVLADIREAARGKALVSIAAGVTVAAIRKGLGAGARVARAMPNIPVAEGEGVVGFFAGTLSAREGRALAKLLSGLGLALQVKDEKRLADFTLLSGCGPGIVAYLIAAMVGYAHALGIKEPQAETTVFQTFKGTVAHMAARRIPAKKLMSSVATKGGVTEAILSTFDRNGMRKAFSRGMDAGRARLGRRRR